MKITQSLKRFGIRFGLATGAIIVAALTGVIDLVPRDPLMSIGMVDYAISITYFGLMIATFWSIGSFLYHRGGKSNE